MSERREMRHTSHSSKDLWGRCQKSWFLRYMAQAPKRPAMWSAGGSAVHEATEIHDLMAVVGDAESFKLDVTWQLAYEKFLTEAREAEPNENVWRRSKTEGVEEWGRLGPQFVQSWIDWRERSSYEVWTTPDGEPAIELEVSGMLPGCPVEIKAFVDRVFYEPNLKRYDVIDIKTGKSKPGPEQFITYAALLKQKYGLETAAGVPFMTRKDTVGTPYDLADVDPAEVGAVFGEAWAEIEKAKKSGVFKPDETERACYLCDVSAACYWKNGPLAAEYDPLHPEHPDYTGKEAPPF